MQQTYEIIPRAVLTSGGVRAFDQARQCSLRDGRERGGVYLVHNGKIYDAIASALGATHSVPANDYLTSFHTHPRTREAVSSADLVVTLANPRDFHRDDCVVRTYGRNIMVSNWEIWSYAPTEGAVQLMMDPSLSRQKFMNVVYWTASIIKAQFAMGVIAQTTYQHMIRHLDPVFAHNQLKRYDTVKGMITAPHPNGADNQFGDLDTYLDLVQAQGILDLFADGEVGFDIQLEHVWRDRIAHMPALSDPGETPASVEAAVKRLFGIADDDTVLRREDPVEKEKKPDTTKDQ